MRRTLILTVVAALSAACNSAGPVAQRNAPAAGTPERAQTAIAHNSGQPAPESKKGAPWKQSGDPIETKELDAAIASAEVALKKSPSDEALKKKLGEAYYNRATALTEARQYASALGDYRRSIKNDPSNADAKDWIDKVVMIYESMGRDAPSEGEEPPALNKTKPTI